MIRLFSGLLLSLVVAQAAAATCPVNAHAPNGQQQWCGCPGSANERSAASAIDLSHRAINDPALLDRARDAGIRTVFRYYDWAHQPGQYIKLGLKRWELRESGCEPDKPCEKVVNAEEIAALHRAGMSVGIVFQHDMHNMDTWRDSKRAAFDADRALQLAGALGQPKGTAIYFGVDGADQNFIDHHDKTGGMELIKAYFRVVNRKLHAAGYDVGVYGSGLVCDKLLDPSEPLARYCWLSLSTGHPDSRARESTGKWTIKQCATRARFQGSASEVDPDIVNSGVEDFGQWRPAR